VLLLIEWTLLGIKLAIAAEGKRNLDGGILPFKKGAFHVAVETQLPITPCVISSYLSFYDPEESKFNAGKVIVRFLPAIKTQGLTTTDVDDLLVKVRMQMIDAFNDLTAEVNKLSVVGHENNEGDVIKNNNINNNKFEEITK